MNIKAYSGVIIGCGDSEYIGSWKVTVGDVSCINFVDEFRRELVPQHNDGDGYYLTGQLGGTTVSFSNIILLNTRTGYTSNSYCSFLIL